MCGIAGFVGQSGGMRRDERGRVLDRMCRVIRHRGPDEQGVMLEGEAALGMRRLSIIDLAGGHQPLSGCDPNLSLVFNGEIYNFQELQRELEARGHRFHTHSDTEAIVHAFEEYGEDCVKHLRGMFVFALWDARARRLFIARDRAGKKPLYYAETSDKTLVFGSELKSLLEHPEVKREVNPEAVDAYLSFGYVPEPLSIFEGVRKLPPASHLTFEDGRTTIKEYWDFPFDAEPDVRSEAELSEELRALLDEAVRVRLISDVPLGAFLSGGVDSSVVVGLMARASSKPVKTFSIGFHEDSYNELQYARVAARHFSTDHHEFIVTPDICQIVDELVHYFDEPFADSSAIPTYMVAKLARAHVTVALSGDGGDELFAGYTRYVVDRRRSGFASLPRALRQGLMQPLSRSLPHGAWGRNFLYNVAQEPLERYIESVSMFTSLNKRSLLSADFRKRLKGRDHLALLRFRELAASLHARDPLNALLYLDSKTYLPGDILTKVDRMTMAVSLEARAPLLDTKLMEFAARLPASMKMRGLETKYIFKRAVRDLVPAEILDRPKQGFGIPLDKWINEQLRERTRETLTERRTRERGLVNHHYVERLLDEHERKRRDHSGALWTLLMLELWHRAFVDRSESFSSTASLASEPLTPVVA
jgi:asparagine synthase (glutamine-hydrolysing)